MHTGAGALASIRFSSLMSRWCTPRPWQKEMPCIIPTKNPRASASWAAERADRLNAVGRDDGEATRLRFRAGRAACSIPALFRYLSRSPAAHGHRYE